MLIVDSAGAMKTEADAVRKRGSIGLVPTMGYFHEGHVSLMRQARRDTDVVVVSLYVNPTQFGPGEDLGSYPRDFERDCEMAREAGVDIMFAPARMYAPDHATYVVPERLTGTLCGASRPGHFRGVATIVAKLFNTVKPHRAYFGMKDFQQVRVIETMIRDLDFDLELVRCPIVRERDGLAMSSRNSYLSREERRAATVLRRTLVEAEQKIVARGERDAGLVVREMETTISAEPLANIDYVQAVDPATLEPVEAISGSVLLALAVHFGRARLIDNTLVDNTLVDIAIQ